AAMGGRRHPLRFIWQMDAEARLTVSSDEFIALAGARTAALLGQPWPDIAAALGLDPEGQVPRALATHQTWSGLVVAWPLGAGEQRLTVELFGLPVFDRERVFCGYRGFGVCRDVASPNAAAPLVPSSATPPAESAVPLRPGAEPNAPALNSVERSAFRELARRLTEHLNGPAETPDPADLTPDTPRSAGPPALPAPTIASPHPLLAARPAPPLPAP